MRRELPQPVRAALAQARLSLHVAAERERQQAEKSEITIADHERETDAQG